MKPWFAKEADIIKFPEPKAKVIELPNVQSYPDFLTGVKDLHNRKDKGEISQASHDKLYTDLIHRFMKKESFETPWFLREDATAQTDQSIDQLVNMAKDDPKIQNYVQKVFNKVIAVGKKTLGIKQEDSLNENPAEMALAQSGQITKEIIDKLLADLGSQGIQFNQKAKTLFDKSIKDIQAYQAKKEKQDVAKGAEAERQALNDFLTKFDSTIDALTNKITSSEQAFIDANSYDKTVKIKKQVQSSKDTIRVIKGVIGSIFTGKIFKKGNIDNKELQKKLLNFLTAAKDGIVDWGKIISAGKGNKAKVESFVPAEYKEIFEMFKTQLFNARPPTTAGAWGPGEVGLILLGNPITKAGDKGDLMDKKTGDKFELKGSKSAKKGGRLSPDGLATSKMPGVFKKIKDKYFSPSVLKKVGPKSAINSNSFTQKFIDDLNKLIDAGMKFNKPKNFLVDVIKGAFTDKIPTDKELKPYIDKMIVGKKIDAEAFKLNYAKFLFNRYKGTDGASFKNIIVFNPGTTTYTVLDNADDLESPDLEITGGIEFGGHQVPKSPQIGIA